MSSDTVLDRFDIQLDAGDEPVFKGGEVITGKLHIKLNRPMTINAVKLQLKGRAAWKNDPVKGDDIEKVYFDQDFTLLERPPGKPEPGHFTWIDDFNYSLPFECPLPKGCPTTYEGPHAFIRYFIKATLIQEEDDGQIHQFYVKKAFSLVSPSDGHLIVGEAATVADTAVFGKCCCKGKLTAELSLPKTGYLPGESVVGSLKIGSKHPKDILQHVEVRLVDRVARVNATEKTPKSPYRTLFYRKLDSTDVIKGKTGIQKDGLFLLSIPPVCPTTKGDFEAVTNKPELSPVNRLLESPSTATLRFRRQPFIRIEYAVQLSLGTHLLLEIPIEIGELSTKDSDTVLQDFVAGPQPLDEVDEKGKIAFKGPFDYTPVYPVKEFIVNGNTVPAAANGGSLIPATIEEEPLITLSHHKDNLATASPASEHGDSVITTTSHIMVSHQGGHETHTIEETVVESDGAVHRIVEETTLTEDGVETKRIEDIKMDSEGHVSTTVEETQKVVDEIKQPEFVLEAREKIEEALDAFERREEEEKKNFDEAQEHEYEQGDSSEPAAHEPEPEEQEPEHEKDPIVIKSEIVDGDEIITTTEVHEENGERTSTTTTVTHHGDGSVSTMVEEHTTKETTLHD